MTPKLRIRRNGKYYQAGYFENCKWVNVDHLGTAEQIVAWHNLVRRIKENPKGMYQWDNRTKMIKLS